jgi:DNA-binding response OmpR family regulator
LTDDPEKNRRAIVPSVGDGLTISRSGLVRRGLQELSSLRPGQVIPLPEGARVLICDDEELLVELFEKILLEAGYEVRSTLNSLEAFEIAREFQPHMALLGEIMPRMDGFKLAERLRMYDPRTKVVLTSEAEPSDLEIFRERGWPFDILVRPFQKEELVEKTRAWVREAGGTPPR